jgi:hypothetical protein
MSSAHLVLKQTERRLAKEARRIKREDRRKRNG